MALLTKRLAIAREIAFRNGSLKDVSVAWGVSVVRVWSVLKQHDPDLKRELIDGYTSKRFTTREEGIRRLQIVYANDSAGIARAVSAKQIQLSHPALTYWLARNAPFGVKDALDDYLYDEEEEYAA